MSIDITVSFIVRLLLVFIFLRAALHKVTHYHHFNLQLQAYRLLPQYFLPAFSFFLAFTEGYIAFALLVQGWAHPSLIAAGLLTLYAFVMSINLSKGRIELDCGCRGPSEFPQTLSWPLVIRNIVLVALALVTALPTISRGYSTQDVSTIILASSAIIFLYNSIDQAIANQQRQKLFFALKPHDKQAELS